MVKLFILILLFAFIWALVSCSGDFSQAARRDFVEIDAGGEGFPTGGDIGAGGSPASGGKTHVATGGAPPASGGATSRADAAVPPSDSDSGPSPKPQAPDASPPPDTTDAAPSPCEGCLDSSGLCHEGNERNTCGSGGAACEDCAAADFLDTMSHSALYCAPGFTAVFSRTCELGGVCKKNSLSCCTKLGHCA